MAAAPLSQKSPQRKKGSRFWPWAGGLGAMAVVGLCVALLGLLFLTAEDIYQYQDSVDGVHLPRVDAIACLAGGRGRIAFAGDLWYRYRELKPEPGQKAPLLFLAGMGKQARWPTLLGQLRRGVKEVIRPEDVTIENQSENTEENAKVLVAAARASGWARVLLVTSPYHMRRARYIFEKVSIRENYPLQIETLSAYQEPFESGEWRGSLHGIQVTLFEYFKWVYYRYIWG